MSSAPQPKPFRFRRWLMRVGIRVMILLLIYVLSIGPMYWQWVEAMMTGENEALLVFYLPLMLAAEKIPPFRDVLHKYVDLWVFA
mgnify:CR=1 FL=1